MNIFTRIRSHISLLKPISKKPQSFFEKDLMLQHQVFFCVVSLICTLAAVLTYPLESQFQAAISYLMKNMNFSTTILYT